MNKTPRASLPFSSRSAVASHCDSDLAQLCPPLSLISVAVCRSVLLFVFPFPSVSLCCLFYRLHLITLSFNPPTQKSQYSI